MNDLDEFEEYDRQLKADFRALQEYIRADEQRGKDFMRVEGASEEMINRVARSLRSEGSRIRFDGFTRFADRLLEPLEQLIEAVAFFPFRLYLFYLTGWPDWGIDYLSIQVATEDDRFWFNTHALAEEERTEFVMLMMALLDLNLCSPYTYGARRMYPSPELILLPHRICVFRENHACSRACGAMGHLHFLVAAFWPR